MEFVIPMNQRDMRSRSSMDQYVVDEVFPMRLLPAKIQECRSAYRSKGPLAILDCFDNIYSVLVNLNDVSPELKEDAWDIVLKALPAHASVLVELLESDAIQDSSTRRQHLSAVKMAVYLLCQLIDAFEAETTQHTTITVAKGRKKAQVRSNTSALGSLDWEYERERAVQALLQLLNLGLHRLWDPPVVEEDFVSLVSGSCYKLLENPNINKHKSTRDVLFQLLGIMVKKYNHSLSCTLKLVQLLQHFEHLAAPIAGAVAMFAGEQYGAAHMAGEMMREIGRTDPRDLARDTAATKAYAAFLVELAERAPRSMIKHISVLVTLLDQESYTMRNSVLGVLGQMVIGVLSKEDGQEEKEKNTRDQFLDKLEDHIHDVNAFVRSRALQIWLSLVEARCMPVTRHCCLLELAIGRLIDRSCQVRRSAVQLVTALLRNNPYAAKLPIEELQAQYEKEKEKLAAITPDPTPNSQDLAHIETEEEWAAIEAAVKKATEKHFTVEEKEDEEEMEKDEEKDNEKEKEEETVSIGDDETEDSVCSRIIDYLKEQQFTKAIQLLTSALEAFSTSALFGPTEKLVTDDESTEELSKAAEFAYRFKVIFVGHHLHEKLAATANTQSSEASSEAGSSQEPNSEVTKQTILVGYLKDSLLFVTKLQSALHTMCQLLGSKTVSDVLEAIQFFVTGFEFGLANSMSGIRRMLVLVWSKEASIKEAVVDAYKRLYMKQDEGGVNARARSVAIVNNLTALSIGATMGDLTSLEKLLCEFVASGELDSGTIQMMWERFALKIPGTTEAESRAALQLLAMAAGAEVAIVKSNVEVLVKEGLGPRAEKDLFLAKETCNALDKLAGTKKKKAGEYEEPLKFPREHEIFERLAHILVSCAQNVKQMGWVPLCEQAVNVIYKLAENPDTICGEIIKKIAKYVMSPDAELLEQMQQTLVTQEKQKQQEEQDNKEAEDAASSSNPPSPTPSSSTSSSAPTTLCSSVLLTRLLVLVGHVAFRQLVHIDVAVFGEMKRRHAVKEKQTEKDKKDNENKKKDRKGVKSEVTEEEEMGLAGGAVAEDAEAEYIRKITETEIVTGNSSLLSLFRPLLVSVCTNQNKYADPSLQAAASLALAKYMLVSSEFCEEHLQLLFTILEKSPHALIRANTIVALGDLTFRFPNLIEPWTPNLYARLRDTSPQVRKNTLMVLTHLILNDMVKVKGQISELATCIVDDDNRIAGLSRLFFHELAKKGNAIYNIMPDMVSRLSDPEIGVDEEHFRIIMKYLFSFIQKDRQCESLVEKLCHRFRATRTDRQARDLAFCLSLLSYSEKSMRKLQENFPCFADKLHDEEVYNCFATVISGAKKFAKPEARAAVDEFEQVLEQVHNKGVEDEEVAQKANKVSHAARALKDKSKTPGRRRKSTATRSSPKHQRTPRQRPPRKNPLYTKEEQAEEDAADDDFHPVKKARAGGGGKKSKPKLVFSSDEEIDDDSDEDAFKPDDKSDDDIPSDSENTGPTISSPASPEHLKQKKGKSVNRKGKNRGPPSPAPPRHVNLRR